MTEYWLSASSKGVIVPSGFSPIGLSSSSLEKEIKERKEKYSPASRTHPPHRPNSHPLKSLNTEYVPQACCVFITGKTKGVWKEEGGTRLHSRRPPLLSQREV